MICQLSLTCSPQNTFADVVFLMAAGGSVITSVFFLTYFVMNGSVPLLFGPMAAELGGLVIAVGFYVSDNKFDIDYNTW